MKRTQETMSLYAHSTRIADSSSLPSTSFREIEIAKGIRILVDAIDYERIASKKWTVQLCAPRLAEDPLSTAQAQKFRIFTSEKIGTGRYLRISLQRYILDPPTGKFAKQLDPSKSLDFRRENLAIYSQQQQSRNLPKRRKGATSSIYKGVSFRRDRDLWAAMIFDGTKQILLGYFATEEEAAHAYNSASRKYFGDEGYLNSVEEIYSSDESAS